MIYLILAGVLTFVLISYFIWAAVENWGAVVGFWTIIAIIVVIIWMFVKGMSEVVG